MNLIDMRTLVINQLLTYAICMIVAGLLWRQNRHRFSGSGYWLACFAMQAGSMLLIVLRGTISDWLSIMIGGNALPLGATILMYIGLEQFVGQRSRQIHNLILLLVSAAIHAYFAFGQANLAARNINLSFFGILVYLQIVWLTLRRVSPELRPITARIGHVFLAFTVVAIARIVVNLIEPQGNDFLKANGGFDALLLLVYQILFFAAVFGLFLMINQRLFWEMQAQQTALQKSEVRYRQLVEFAPEALYVYTGGRFVLANSAALRLLRASQPEQLIGKPVMDVIHPDFHAIASQRIQKALALGETAPLLEEKFIRLDGTLIDVEVTTAPIDYQGQPALQTIVRDITERKRAEAILQLRLKLLEFAANHSLEELMRRALDEIGEMTNSPIGFYHFVETNQETLSLQAWSTRTMQEFCHAEGAGMHYNLDQAGVWAECIYKREPVIHNDYASLPNRKGLPPGHAAVKRELVIPTIIDGRIVSILGIGNRPTDYEADDVTLVSYVADVIWGIVERKRNDVQLQAYQRQLEAQNLELRKLSLAIEQSGNTVVIADPQGTIQYVNPAFEQISGYSVSEAIGQNPRILKSGEQSVEFYQKLWDTITSGQIWRGEFHNRRKDGSLYWEAATIAPVQDNAGQITNYIAIKEDITERKRLEANLERLATTDSLTGVLNRRQLTKLADLELERAQRYQHPTSVIMLDIDHFKKINDRYGHAAGDLAIQQTAQTLLENLRNIDYLGRYGGDEFTIVLPETDLERAQQIAERLRTKVEKQSIQSEEKTIQLSISLGLACVSSPAETPPWKFDAATQLADKALYAAKEAGRNCVRVYPC